MTIEIGNGTTFYGQHSLEAQSGYISIGRNCSFNNNVQISADFGGEVIIGDNVMVAWNVVIVANQHGYADLSIPMRDQVHIPGTIIIEDDVWIGSNSVITSDVKISHGAIVGAGAVVTRDVPEFSIVGGVPARIIGDRRR